MGIQDSLALPRPFKENPRDIRVETGCIVDLVTIVYRHLLEATDDDLIEWYASVIKMALADRVACIPAHYEGALEKVLAATAYQALRTAAFHDGTLKVGYEF
jgi:hypothetical protein